jgi:hypothetical protein
LEQFRSNDAAASGGVAPATPQKKATNKPIEIASQLSLAGIDGTWAVENRGALEATLRSTLKLTAAEELIITSISKMRRTLEATSRNLQSTGVKIDFVLGVSNPQRASAQQSALTDLSSGKQTTLMQFVVQLDVELTQRGKTPVRLDASAIAFTQPSVSTLPTPQQSGTSGQLWSFNNEPNMAQTGSYYNNFNNMNNGQRDNNSATIATDKKSGDSTSIILIVGGLCLIVYLVYQFA